LWWGVKREEGVAQGGVSEGFCAAGAQGGERAGKVAEGCGLQGVLAVEPGAEEAGVEAVASSDGVYRVDEDGLNPGALGALLDEGSAGSAFDGDEGDAGCEGVQGGLEGGSVGDL